MTAGTIFDRTRTPLTVWFNACCLFAPGKDGISALSLQRTLEMGSYQTAWAMLHGFRSVLVRPGRDRLSGRVEVDETFIGGLEPGLTGGRAKGRKVLTGIAVEVFEPKGTGRCRIAPLQDGSAVSLHASLADHVEPGARVITDAWQGYAGIEKLGYDRDRRSQRAAAARREDAGELLPEGTRPVWNVNRRTGPGEQPAPHVGPISWRPRSQLQPPPGGPMSPRVLEPSRAELEARRGRLLARLAMSRDELVRAADSGALTGEPYRLLEDIRSIEFLLGTDDAGR